MSGIGHLMLARNVEMRRMEALERRAKLNAIEGFPKVIFILNIY
jgi:hypothetical protein